MSAHDRDVSSFVERRRILLVRHGQTRSNIAGEAAPLSGWYDVMLTEQGHREARALAGWFSRLKPVPVVLASSSSRAMETARLMVATTSEKVSLQGRDDLREIYCGELEGVPLGRLQTGFPELWRENLSQSRDDFRWPGGESYAELRVRAISAVSRIIEQHDAESVVLVTHAGFIAQILGSIRGAPAGAWAAWRPRNASVTTVDWGTETAKLLHYDDVSHLEGLQDTGWRAFGGSARG